ncbi:hypothetical protein KKE06_03195 [Candidatus Micrarchaeota archaeon]|nr:hypothetical protein [Candidatus Micrarchaeota archaeon]
MKTRTQGINAVRQMGIPLRVGNKPGIPKSRAEHLAALKALLKNAQGEAREVIEYRIRVFNRAEQDLARLALQRETVPQRAQALLKQRRENRQFANAWARAKPKVLAADRAGNFRTVFESLLKMEKLAVNRALKQQMVRKWTSLARQGLKEKDHLEADHSIFGQALGHAVILAERSGALKLADALLQEAEDQNIVPSTPWSRWRWGKGVDRLDLLIEEKKTIAAFNLLRKKASLATIRQEYHLITKLWETIARQMREVSIAEKKKTDRINYCWSQAMRAAQKTGSQKAVLAVRENAATQGIELGL